MTRRSLAAVLVLFMCSVVFGHAYTQSERDTYDAHIDDYWEAYDNHAALQAWLDAQLELPPEERAPQSVLDAVEDEIQYQAQQMVFAVNGMQIIWDDHGHGP